MARDKKVPNLPKDYVKRIKEQAAQEPEEKPAPSPQKKNHPWSAVESITIIVIEASTNTKVEVWRTEDRLEPGYTLANIEVWQAIKAVTEKFHPMYLSEIANALAKLPRVRMVKVTNDNGGVAIHV